MSCMSQIEKNCTSCPNCEKVASSHYEILSLFGFRNMSDGVTRVQSWCKECRKKSSKGVVN